MSKELTLEEIQNFEGKYPKQLWYLFLVEMWERFCFYGMRGVLAIFMVDMLLLSDKEANLKYGAIQAFVYAFTFIGGVFADKILGFKKSLLFGGIVMITGNFLIGLDPEHFFYYGITLSIIGTGFFKPNISSMVGELYKEGDSRRDAGFSLFYSGINIGALLGGALCVYLGKFHGWNLAFFAAAAVMVIGIVIFLATKKSLAPIGNSPLMHLEPKKRGTREIAVYIGAALCIPLIHAMIENTDYTDYFMYAIGPAALIYFFFELSRQESSKVKKKLIAALLFIAFSIIFFAFFEQSGGSLSLFAKGNLTDKLLFFTIDPNIVNNVSNAFFVILFAPVLGLVWVALSKKKLEPNTVIKFGLGFLFLAGSFFILYSTKFFAGPDGITSLNIFTSAYLIMTLGELCLSPIGLSIITKLSPNRLVGMMMGLWFLASAYGQYAAGLLGANMASPNENATNLEKLNLYTDGYYQLAIYALIAGVVLILISPIIRKLMQEVK
ncbi:peptide MFS transporter [Myroides indicus]|uniref:POT family proton-dependent oligopeptide transporter n=1 Tax=Myroides indicus TaxID=1323422 RepID=A0A4V3E8V8_9FLAO|nr:peptide MFS transporter [Myroides indicus]TDS62045.1 POT family proton-dependent oligopeptide transporter [Myroides indicus]